MYMNICRSICIRLYICIHSYTYTEALSWEPWSAGPAAVRIGHGALKVPIEVGEVRCFVYESGVLFVGVLIIKALLFEVHVRTPDFWKPPDTKIVFIASGIASLCILVSEMLFEGGF